MKRIAVGRNLVTVASLLACVVALPAARADEVNQMTRVTFHQTVEISGHILAPGTYLFVLPDDINQHEQLRIFSPDGRKLYAMILTAYTERPQPTDNTAFTIAKRDPALPDAIVTWFYPDKTVRHEFLYAKQVQKELATDQQVTIAAGN
jgi:hypothetical protein